MGLRFADGDVGHVKLSDRGQSGYSLWTKSKKIEGQRHDGNNFSACSFDGYLTLWGLLVS